MATIERTLNITDQDLHSSLNDFLEENEKKSKQSIWNFSTISGLFLVLVSAAYVGHSIGTTVFDLGSIPLINTLMKIAPYFGGALLGGIILSNLTRNKSKDHSQIQEKQKVKETYDKLDEFLYADKNRKNVRSKKNESSYHAFNVKSGQKLTRSRSDKKMAGVCGGLAKHLGINSTVLRVIFVAALFLSFNTFIFVYIALAFVIPKEPISFMDDFK